MGDRWRLAVLNVLLPGAGLLIAGHLGAGLALLVPSVVVLALVVGVLGLFATAAAALPLLLGLLGGELLLAATAGGLWWWYDRRGRYDPLVVRSLHRQAAAAYLRNERPAAMAKALALTRAAPEEAGTWRFLALVAADAGDQPLAARAERRAQAIDDR